MSRAPGARQHSNTGNVKNPGSRKLLRIIVIDRRKKQKARRFLTGLSGPTSDKALDQ
jgi:hypothetical protein